MDRFNVKGIAGFDGDYPIDIGTFSMRELHIIKDVAGVRAGELEEAFSAGDTDVILAVAVIAVRRKGGDFKRFQALAWEAEMGSLYFFSECKIDGCEREAKENNDGCCEMHSEADEGTAGEAVPLNPPAPNSSSGEATPESSGSDSSGNGDDHPETSLRAIGGLS